MVRSCALGYCRASYPFTDAMGSAGFFLGNYFVTWTAARACREARSRNLWQRSCGLRGLTHLAPFASVLKAVVPKAGAAK